MPSSLIVGSCDTFTFNRYGYIFISLQYFRISE
uniref:Uncharacterized protein n=1 Tax=Siphoviridae sp. ctvod4 TaxID=2827595 RepID=A0A8S5LL38_9CAUD|nr:MAG TPA: hypothetical protein [Siphoviridae sp. ctvod4]